MDVLDLLSQSQFVSGEVIAKSLNISRAAVHKRVEKLRRLGYAIDGGQNLGYSLIARPDRLTPEEISRYLHPGSFINGIVYFEETGSTQTLAKERALAGAPEGTLVIAERQKDGYGRLGRRWSSPKGGIWFSLVLRPDLPPERTPQLTLVASVSLCGTIERLTGVRAMIKWPNDLLAGGRKLCGILTEMSAEVGRVNWVVVGVGLNANNAVPPGLGEEAVTLAEASGRKVNRPQLAAGILNDFSAAYGRFRREGFAAFRERYNGLSFFRGKDIEVVTGGRAVVGRAEGVDDDGYLRLSLPGGRERIIVGDVSMKQRKG